MSKSSLMGAVCACAITFISLSANAALLERLGGLAYYDDVAKLTWLADANPIDMVTWHQATDWVNTLNVNGVTGWRLPATDESCTDTYNCINSELGILFFSVLGGNSGTRISVTHNSHYNLFTDIQDNNYWSQTEYDESRAYVFSFYDSRQDLSFTTNRIGFAWAVYDGDVALVPIPPALWLFGSGLLGLVGMARRKA